MTVFVIIAFTASPNSRICVYSSRHVADASDDSLEQIRLVQSSGTGRWLHREAKVLEVNVTSYNVCACSLENNVFSRDVKSHTVPICHSKYWPLCWSRTYY